MSVPPGPAQRPLAVDRNGELHDTAAIESAPASLVPPLRCADCGAPLEAVRAHPRRERATIVHVAAHYRLAPGAAHATACRWREQPPSPSPAPAARPGARLPVPPLVYSLVVAGRGDTQAAVWRQRAFRPARRPALNSAAKVADLLARYGDTPSELRLDYRGRPVSWHDFLFTCADAARLAGLLRREQPTHPVAMVGYPGDRHLARSGSSYVWNLAEQVAGPGSHPSAARAVLRSTDGHLLGGDSKAVPVVALGWWQLQGHASAAQPDVVTLWVNRRWQVGRIRLTSD